VLYAIIADDIAESAEARSKARPAHLYRLEVLKRQGRLVLAGPFPATDPPTIGPAGVTGSLIVAEFGSLGEAESWASADPFVESGVYASVLVKPFLKTLP
jgi:uncharacterized protein YciI